MRIAFFDCFGGLTTEMLAGAMVHAGAGADAVTGRLSPLSERFPFALEVREAAQKALAGSQLRISYPRARAGQRRPSLDQLVACLRECTLSDGSLELAVRALGTLEDAHRSSGGARAAGTWRRSPSALRALVAIAVCAAGLEELGATDVFYSSIPVGGLGQRQTPGSPFPSPVCAELLKKVPTAPCGQGPVPLEPEALAFLKTAGLCLAEGWPQMTPQAVGYGATPRGTRRELSFARLVIGERAQEPSQSDHIWVLETNIDDMTGQALGFAFKMLFEAGAVDVFFIPIQMKKNRPGTLLKVLCPMDALDAVETALFEHTSTFGIRRALWQRRKLAREMRRVQTPWGEVAVKCGFQDGRLVRWSPEYEDCRALAEKNAIPFGTVYNHVLTLLPKAPPYDGRRGKRQR